MSIHDFVSVMTALREPFPQDVIQWRPGVISRDKKRAQALAYVDPRAYEDRLDDVLGFNWEVRFVPWGESRITCELTILINGEARTRCSTGEFEQNDDFARGTSAEAQAFKRACSKFGLGRYLYALPVVWVPYDPEKRRLIETPSISTTTARTENTLGIGTTRGLALITELEKLGIHTPLQFASAVLGRIIPKISELTENEAKNVWVTAKKSVFPEEEQ